MRDRGVRDPSPRGASLLHVIRGSEEEGLASCCATSRYGFNNPESLWAPALSRILSRGVRIRLGGGTAEAKTRAGN